MEADGGGDDEENENEIIISHIPHQRGKVFLL